jgi:hypothetical protein
LQKSLKQQLYRKTVVPKNTILAMAKNSIEMTRHMTTVELGLNALCVWERCFEGIFKYLMIFATSGSTWQAKFGQYTIEHLQKCTNLYRTPGRNSNAQTTKTYINQN